MYLQKFLCKTTELFVLTSPLKGMVGGVTLGGYVIGNRYLVADKFEGSNRGTEEIMRIIDTVGVFKE